MKRFAGLFVVLALAGVFAACESSTKTTAVDVIIGVDTLKDGVAQDVPLVGDAARDSVTDGVVSDVVVISDNPGNDNPPPVDGVVTDVPVSNDLVVTDTPNTDNGGGCVDDPVGSCKAVYACIGDCPADATGDACRSQCQGQLSAKGLQDYQTFNTCLQQNCAQAATNEEFYACLDAKCINQYYGCFWGCDYIGCPSLLSCLTSCPADNPATVDVDESQVCIGNCWGGGTALAQIDLQTALNCTRAACPVCSVAAPTPAQDAECNTCWGDASSGACSADWDKCQAYGVQKCGEVFTCVMACADSTCSQACFNNGTKTSITLWNAMIACANDNCTVCAVATPTQPQIDECNTCFNAAINQGGSCADKTLACQNDQSVQ